MKIVTLFSLLLFSFSSFGNLQSSKTGILSNLHLLGKSCIAYSYGFHRATEYETVEYRNSCPEIQMIDEMSALIDLGKTQVIVMLIDSDGSDGGDLNDLAVFGLDGKLITREKNILAFGNLLRALAQTGP